MSTSQDKQTLLQKVLNRFDINEDDIITFSEFKQALESEGVDSATADAIRKQVFSNWDANNDKKLQKKEVEKLAKKWASFQ